MTATNERLAWALQQRPKYAGDKLVLIALAQFADPETECVQASKPKIEAMQAFCSSYDGFVVECAESLIAQKYVELLPPERRGLAKRYHLRRNG